MPTDVAYLLQQLINATLLACVYALLAAGYTLIYAIIGRINLAFGDMATVGGYATLSGIGLLPFVWQPSPLSLATGCLLALAVGAYCGWLSNRLVFRPLAGARSLGPLVASVGLAIAVQEYLRLSYGADNRWLAPVTGPTFRLTPVAPAGFSVTVSALQLLIAALTVTASAALLALLKFSRFGRHHRACAEDPGMATLCGVNVGRTVMVTFMLSTAYAGLAGFVMTLYYGVVNFYMGFSYGLKALTAAIVGGIGSLPGALLGSALIALLETLWSAYFPLQYRDVAVFGLLIATLVLCPNGLLGRRL